MTPEQAISCIHTMLDTLVGAHVPWDVGDKARGMNQRPPFIFWQDAQSATTPSPRAGGNPTPIGLDIARFSVSIWQEGPPKGTAIESREAVRALFDNLRVAARRAPEVNRAVKFGNYQILPDTLANRGHIIVTEARVELVLLDVATPTVIVSQVATGGWIDDEQVSDGVQDLNS